MLDQVFKMLVKTNMTIGEEIPVIGNWFIIHFTENNGMAFGLDLPGNSGKTLLTLFRLLAITGIAFYLRHLILRNAHRGLILSIALILAGATGNIIDSLFYGLIFNDSWGRVASLFPEGGGYAPLLQGKVVDMLYFPVIQGTWPDWFPWWGGSSLVFFRPVFNLADSSITIGVAIILIWQKRFFSEKVIPERKSEETAQTSAPETSAETDIPGKTNNTPEEDSPPAADMPSGTGKVTG